MSDTPPFPTLDFKEKWQTIALHSPGRAQYFKHSGGARYASNLMPKRNREDRTEYAVNLSGELSGSLRRHAVERAIHFMDYLFTMRVLTQHLNAKTTLNLKPDEGLMVAATEQVDSGFRTSVADYTTFDDTDANVVVLNTSSFGRMDAAHFCNLGIAPAFVSRISNYITVAYANSDPVPRDFYEMLKVICGNTQLLPQRVNIGPDRIIDIMHGELASKMLKAPSAVTTRANVDAYRTEAISKMTTYRDERQKDGDLGIVACAEAYLAAYEDVGVLSESAQRAAQIAHAKKLRSLSPGQTAPDSPEVPVDPFNDTVFQRAFGRATSERRAYKALENMAGLL